MEANSTPIKYGPNSAIPTCFGPIIAGSTPGSRPRANKYASSAISTAASTAGPIQIPGDSNDRSICSARSPKLSSITTKINSTMIAPA